MCGEKIIIPIITAVIAVIKTAAAAISLILPAFSLKLGDIKSTKLSMAVLKISAVNTKPIDKTMAIHSVAFISNIKPNAMASNAKTM